MLVFMCGPISCIHTFFVLCSVWETDSLEVWGKGSNLLWKRIYSSAFHFVRILRSWKDPGDVFQLLVMLPVLFAACPQQQIISLCAGASSPPPPYPVPKHPQQGHSLTLPFHLPFLNWTWEVCAFWSELPSLSSGSRLTTVVVLAFMLPFLLTIIVTIIVLTETFFLQCGPYSLVKEIGICQSSGSCLLFKILN